MAEFTLEDLARVTIEVADERPDHKYRHDPDMPGWCVYANNDGEPMCLYGHSLKRLGVNIAGLVNAGIGTHLSRWFGGGIDDAWYKPFRDAQGMQDNSATWGNAVESLRLAYPQFRKAVDA